MKISIKNPTKTKDKNLILFAFLTVYLITLLYLTYNINISEDETYTLNTTSHNLAGVIRQSYYFEGQPPAYFILLSLWRHLNAGIFWAKLFSILFIGLSAFTFYRLVLFFSGSNCSKWLIVIFLLNPFTVWAALEMRLYSFLIFISTISIYFFLRYYFEDKRKFIYRFLFICVIGIFTQYFFTLLIASLTFTILIFKGWKKFFGFCLYIAPLVLLFLPNLIFLPNELAVHESHGFSYFPFNKILNILHTPQNLMLGINLLPEIWTNRIVRIIFVFVAVYIYFKLYKKHFIQSNFYFERYNIILFSVFFLLVLFIITIYITNVEYDNRYMVVVFPFFMLFFTIFGIYSNFYRRVIYSMISIYFVASLIYNYWHPVKIYDYISVARYIKKIEYPNEPILVYRPAIALPFNYYYNGKNKIVPLPFPVKFDSSFLINIKDTIELRQLIKKINSTSKSYLLISDTTSYEGSLNMNRKMVTEYLSSHYNVTLDTLYSGWSKYQTLRIRRFEKIQNK